MSYPAISLATATVGRYRCPQKRLQTARQPPVYPNSSPRIIAPVTPSPPSAALTPSIPVHRWIRGKGKPVRGAVSEADGAVYLAIDCSASMQGYKLVQAKQGALDFFNEARSKGYSVGLIRFETNARIVCEPQRELASLKRYVSELEVGGTTNMAAGLQLASNRLGKQSGLQAIVVVTDGQPNNQKDALAIAKEAKNAGIDVITIGTADADKAFLARLATRSSLSVVVSDEDLGRGIASTAKMLPGLGSGQQVSGR